MQEMDAYAYKFEALADWVKVYLFITTKEIRYRVRFELADYLFSGIPSIGHSTFEMTISVEYKSSQPLPTFDEKISLTISAILKDFFTKQNDLVILYICDFSDGKQNARERKFSNWFEKYKGNEFKKISVPLTGTNEQDSMFFSVIFRIGNLYQSQMIDTLEKLKWDYQFAK